MACSSGDSRLLRRPSGGHAGERERRRAAARGGQRTRVVVGVGQVEGLVGSVVNLLLLGPPFFIVGRGYTLTPPPRHQEHGGQGGQEGRQRPTVGPG
jgi:hypothetical protein